MDEMLMLHGVLRWCSDCAAETIFVPVLDADPHQPIHADRCLCCTACDAAVYAGLAA